MAITEAQDFLDETRSLHGLIAGLDDAALAALLPLPEVLEKDRAQAALNFCVFATLALTSFASGVLVTTQGWALLNLGSLLPVVLTGAAIAWLMLKPRTMQSS